MQKFIVLTLSSLMLVTFLSLVNLATMDYKPGLTESLDKQLLLRTKIKLH
jgi:hypothetical protein